MEENKPFYKRAWFIVLAIIFVIGVAFNSQDEKKETEEAQPVIKEEQKEINRTIEVNEELLFLNHRNKIKKVKVYEKDGKLLIDIPVDWRNTSFPDKTTFFRANSLDVFQGEHLLEEANNAWANKNSNVYFPNAVGGEWKVDLTYELIDDTTPVKLVFVVFDEYDENEELTIEIK